MVQVLGGAPPRLRDARRGRQLAPGDVEEELFGFPPFADPSSPTYLEAADRLVELYRETEAQDITNVRHDNPPRCQPPANNFVCYVQEEN